MPLSCLRSCLFEVNEVNPDVPVHYQRAGYDYDKLNFLYCLPGTVF